MHKNRIQKFQNPGGGGIQFTTPGVQNTGFSFLQQLSPYTSALASMPSQIPKIGGKSFQAQFPAINAAADSGDVLAMKLRFDHQFREGQQALADAAILKNPFNGNPINTQGPSTIKSVDTPDPSTIKSVGSGGGKTPFFESKAGKGVMMGAQAGQMVGDAFINSGLSNYKENGNTELRRNLSAAGRQAVQTFMPGWGHLIAAADSLVEGLGGKTDTSEGLGAGNDIGNMVASIALPGAGWLVGKTKKYSQSEDIKKSSAYTGEAAAGEKVAKNAGAKLLFGRGKANEATRRQQLRDINTEGVLADARDARQASNYGGFSIGNQITMLGGIKPLRVKNGAKLDKLISARELLQRMNVPAVEVVEVFEEGGKTSRPRTLEQLIKYAKQKNPRFVQRMSEPIRDIDLGNGLRGTHRLSWGTTDNPNEAIVYPKIFENENGELVYDPEHAFDNAKKGDMLIMTPEEAEIFTKGYKQGWPEFFQKFREGGKVNVIPSGQLHKNRHHMEDIGDEYKDLTNKGIPVVTDGEGGELVQQAEIERDEIIFNIDVTKKLEELMEDGSDEAALEAGKLLAIEIMENTVDNTGLMKEIS